MQRKLGQTPSTSNADHCRQCGQTHHGPPGRNRMASHLSWNPTTPAATCSRASVRFGCSVSPVHVRWPSCSPGPRPAAPLAGPTSAGRVAHGWARLKERLAAAKAAVVAGCRAVAQVIHAKVSAGRR